MRVPRSIPRSRSPSTSTAYPPVTEVAQFTPIVAGINEHRDLFLRSVDQTANSIHVFLDLPAAVSEAEILAQVAAGDGATGRIDRDLFVYGFQDVVHGNHVATTVTFEPSGNFHIQRTAGVFTETILGAGHGNS